MHTLSEMGDVDSLEKLVNNSDLEGPDQDSIENFSTPEAEKRDTEASGRIDPTTSSQS